MIFELTDEHKLMRQMVREFAETEIAPGVAERDEQERFDRALMYDKLGELGLAGRCESSNRGTPLGDFLRRLEVEIAAQKSIVSDVIRRLGGRESLPKKGTAWLAEKLGRLKLNDSLLRYSDLSRVIELEVDRKSVV